MDKVMIAQTVGNRVADSAIGDYLNQKARNTIRMQAAALDLVADYLDAAVNVGAAMRRFAAAVAILSRTNYLGSFGILMIASRACS